jgi:hypothetical protein
MTLTRAQIDKRHLRNRTIKIQPIMKPSPIGTRRTTGILRPSLIAAQVESVVESCAGASSNTQMSSLDDEILYSGTMGDFACPSIPAPILQPDDKGIIAHHDSLEAANTSALRISRDGTVSVDELDVGIPNDGVWDQFAAFKSRICFEHGKEYLLGCHSRWMRPTDFDPSKRDELVTKLRVYQINPYDFETLNSKYQSDCKSALWSQVDTPIAEGRCGEDVVFLIRWKLVWTPVSNMDDPSWAESSCKVQEERTGRRSSGRLEATAKGRAERTIAMAAVFKEISKL